MTTSKLPTQQLARLSGHNGPIHALTYSSGTGQYLLSGSSDRTINLWNPSKTIPNNSSYTSSITSSITSKPIPISTTPIQTYSGIHGYEVLSVSVSSDNARFVSAGGDKTVFLWDVSTAQTLKRYSGHSGRVECAIFGGDDDSVIISGSFDATVRLWDVKSQSGKPLMVLQEARDSVTSLVCSGAEVVAGSVDGRVRTYDLRMGRCFVDVLGEPVTSLTMTVQGDSVLVSTSDSTLRLMDRANGKMLQSYKDAGFVNTTYRIRSTSTANDGIVLSGAEDGRIYAWDVLSGQVVQRLSHYAADDLAGMRNSRKVVSAVAARRKGDQWASASGDGSIAVWGEQRA